MIIFRIESKVLTQVDALFVSNNGEFQESDLAKTIDEQVEEISSNISNMTREDINSTHFESFDSNLLNKKLLGLLESFELEEVGLDATFRETLQDLDQRRRAEQRFKESELKMYNYDTKSLENNMRIQNEENEREGVEAVGYYPKTLQTISRKDDSVSLAEQVIISNSIQSRLMLETEDENAENRVEVVENIRWGDDLQLHKVKESIVSTGVYNVVTITELITEDDLKMGGRDHEIEKEAFLCKESEAMKEIFYGEDTNYIEKTWEEIENDEIEKSYNICSENRQAQVDSM